MKYDIFMIVSIVVMVIILALILIATKKNNKKLAIGAYIFGVVVPIFSFGIMFGIRQMPAATAVNDVVIEYEDRGSYALVANEDKTEHIAISYDGMVFETGESKELHKITYRKSLLGIYQDTIKYEMH